MGRLMGSSNSNNYGEQIFINKASEAFFYNILNFFA